MSPRAGTPSSENLGWALWGCFVVALLLAAWSYRREGVQPLAVECTVLAQASSLAHDLDLRYERIDHDRHLFLWRGQPATLDLTRSGGDVASSSWGFDSPLAPALIYAPFALSWPRHGFALANVLALILASTLACWRLARVCGPGVPWWMLGGLLLSPLVVHCFLANGTIPVVAGVLAALGLLVGPAPGAGAANPTGATTGGDLLGHGRTLAAGLLLWPAVAQAWPNLVLIALAGSLLPGGRRGRGLVALVAGLTLAWGADQGLRQGLGAESAPSPTTTTTWTTATWTTATGFPGVDFPLDSVEEGLATTETPDWPRRGGWRLASWRLVDRWIGREGGLLVYFPVLLPWLLVFVARCWRGGWRAARALGGAVVWPTIWLLANILRHPFGDVSESVVVGGDVLPLYAGLLVAAVATGPAPRRPLEDIYTRPHSAVALLTGGALVGALLFLGPILAQPWSLPFAPAGSQVSPLAQRRLPATTTSVPTEPRRVSLGELNGAVELVLLGDGAWYQGRSERLMIEGPSDFLVVAPTPLSELVLARDDELVGFGVAGDLALRSGGVGAGAVQRLVVLGGRYHPLPWTDEPRWVYRLTLAPGSEIARALRLTAIVRREGD